jgi:hypothetical protein
MAQKSKPNFSKGVPKGKPTGRESSIMGGYMKMGGTIKKTMVKKTMKKK